MCLGTLLPLRAQFRVENKATACCNFGVDGAAQFCVKIEATARYDFGFDLPGYASTPLALSHFELRSCYQQELAGVLRQASMGMASYNS